MDPSQVPPSYHYRKWLVLLGSILLQISMGSMFVFGNLTPYIASYMVYSQALISKQQVTLSGLPREVNINELYVFYLCDCNWIFATCFIVFTLSSLLGGHIQQQIGVKKTLILSSVFMCVGTMLCYFTLVNIYALVFCYLLFGCGAGIAYPIPFVSCLSWFKHQNKHKNNYYIIVILKSCFASAPFIFVPIQLSLINPDNIAIHPNYGFIQHHDIIHRIPIMYLYFALIIAILQTIAILLISNPSLDQAYCKQTDITTNMNVAMPPHSCSCHQKQKYIAYNSIYDVSNKDDAADHQMSKLEIILNGKFWQLWMIHFCSMIVYLFVILVWKIFATQYLQMYNDRYLSIIISIAFALNGIFRCVWYSLYQATPLVKNKKKVLLTIYIISSVFVASLSIPYGFDDATKYILYTVWIFAIFCLIGCDWILYPSLIGTTFGQKFSGYAVGYCCIGDILAVIILGAFHLYAMDMNSWQGFTWIISAFLVFSIVLIIVFDPEKIIAERQLKDTIKSVNSKFASYNSIGYREHYNTGKCSKKCGCPNTCNCCHE